MANQTFRIEKHTSLDKRFAIEGPDITLYVDNDDVDQRVVARQAKRLVAILNEHWDNGE